MKSRKAKSPVAFWDIHEKSASRRSDRWAATDRGWLFHECKTALGHYLDYGPELYGAMGNRSPEGNVHAVSISHHVHTTPDGRSVCQIATRDSRYFRTCEQAQRWIESQAGFTSPCAERNPKYAYPKVRTSARKVAS